MNLLKATVSPEKRGKKSKRRHLKNAVLKLLHAASPDGLTVRELSKKIGIKSQNLYTWFNTTGKKVSGLKKDAQGKYVYVGSVNPF